MNKNSSIYIAGHKGLVGSSILRRLERGGFTYLITRTHRELDLTRQAEVEAFLEKETPEYVFLAAARVGGILANSTYPAHFIYENLMIQSNVIHAACRTGVKKLLFLGSSCIYPRDCPQPMKEEHLLSGKLEPTNEPYAVAKIAGIRMCQSYNRQFGTRFISVMPTNLYGPGDNFDLETSHVLPALMRKFHEAKIRRLEVGGRRLEAKEVSNCLEPQVERSGTLLQTQTAKRTPQTSSEAERNAPPNPNREAHASNPKRSAPQTSNGDFVTIWGTGQPMREFLHVDDLADACLFLMENYEESEIINIGAGEEIRISDLAHLVGDIVGLNGEIRFDSSKPDGTPRKLLDVGRLNALGWKSRVPLKEGIRMTYEWYANSLRLEV